jgi:hypothetical protein
MRCHQLPGTNHRAELRFTSGCGCLIGRALQRPGLMAAAEELQRDVVSLMALKLVATVEALSEKHQPVFIAAQQLQPAADGCLRRV